MLHVLHDVARVALTKRTYGRSSGTFYKSNALYEILFKGLISKERVSSAHRDTKVQFIDVADEVRPLKDARRPSFIQKIESKAVQFAFIMDMECSNLTN